MVCVDTFVTDRYKRKPTDNGRNRIKEVSLLPVTCSLTDM